MSPHINVADYLKSKRGLAISFLFSACCLFSSKTTEAKKMDYPLEVVIGIADLIATGKITGISGDIYIFMIDQTIAGNSAKEIKVNMFEEWECDTRQKQPEIDQPLMLFLKENKMKSYDIVNGSTGEKFIVQNKLWAIPYTDQSQNIQDVIIAIKNFRSCYQVPDKKYSPFARNLFKQIKPDQEVSVLGNANKFSKWLFGNMKNYTIAKA